MATSHPRAIGESVPQSPDHGHAVSEHGITAEPDLAEWPDGDEAELDGAEVDPDEVDPDDLDEQYLRLVMRHERGGRDPLRWAPGADHGLPPSLVIGDREYWVRAFFLEEDGEWNLLGRFDSHERLIWVEVGRSLEEQRETLVHEVLHAVDKHALTDVGEEAVGRMAPVLLEALRRNSGLASFLLDPAESSGDARDSAPNQGGRMTGIDETVEDDDAIGPELDEILKALQANGGIFPDDVLRAWADEGGDPYCHDCEAPAWSMRDGDTAAHEDYSVHDDLWDAAAPDDQVHRWVEDGQRFSKGNFVLCVGCFERRLGRELRRVDFQVQPRPLFGIPPSRRLTARWKRR